MERLLKRKVWTALLSSIAITMLLSIINWLYSRSRVVNFDERNEVSLELHWLFLFGLLMSKGAFILNLLLMQKNFKEL